MKTNRKRPPKPASPTDARARWRDAWIPLALAAGAFLLYVPTFWFGFVDLDDPFYIGQPAVRQGLTLHGVYWAFTTPAFANYLPLTWLSHMLDIQLFGFHAGGHHATSAALHALNTALVYVVLRRMTGSVGRSAAVAALFAVHPLRVESVAWIAERKDVLCGTFFLLTLLAYTDYCRRPRPAAYAWTLVAYALGLMAKTMIVTLPFLLLLLDVWPLGRMRRNADGDLASDDSPAAFPPRRVGWLLEKLPMLALAAVASAWTLVYQGEGEALAPGANLSLGQRVANAIVSVARYLGKTIRPVDLSVLYVHPGDWPAWQVAGAAALVVAISVTVLIGAARGRRYLAVGWFWFLGMLVPVAGLVQAGDQAMADRYTYLPGIGLTIAVVWGVAELARARPRLRRALIPAVAGVVVVLACVTLVQQQYWRDTDGLAVHAIEVDPQNWSAHGVLATQMLKRGDAAAARDHFLEAARGLRRVGRVDEGILMNELLAQRYPRDPTVLAECGRALLDVGRRDEAVRRLTDASALAGANPELREQIGADLRRAGATP